MNKIKQLVISGLAGLATAGALSLCSGKQEQPKQETTLEQLTEANESLRSFPTEIPGASTVQKFETPGARYTLVHVRQFHYADGMSNETVTTKVYPVQKDIMHILEHLTENAQLKEVYREGSVAELEPVYEKFRKIAEAFKNGGEELRKSVSAEDLRQYEAIQNAVDHRFNRGAVSYLEKRGKIKVLPAETLEGQKAAHKYRLLDLILDKREDILLEIVAQQNSPRAVTVYGGAHDWRDNIEKWNRENPDKKYSLVVVTPKSYIFDRK